MWRNYLLPLLAIAGFLFGLFSAVRGNQPPPVTPAAVEPAASPFPAFIAGSGIVEASTRNIEIGTPLSGVVDKVAAQVGDKVGAGDLLFRLDPRAYAAQEAVKRAAVAKAKADVNQAQAELNDAATLLRLAAAVTDRRAISTEELDRRRNAAAIAKARLETMRAAEAQADADLATTRTDLERLEVRAPVAGEVLQVNLRPGEFATAGTLSTPLLLLGSLDPLHVRVDVDENDAWRFRREARAVAYLRGNPRFRVELGLAYLEPFVVPKKSLTGDSTERVDTRVLQVLYRFDPATLPAYVGQQMDVFIEAADEDDAGLAP
ncbi:MAG TPA: efflux RND transporter periplasmic adaptor subunit [Methylococcaceae bacterium]|nr:efflux RND transporter periplasmic adaptor subunit [Methylococcaceae bacterium]